MKFSIIFFTFSAVAWYFYGWGLGLACCGISALGAVAAWYIRRKTKQEEVEDEYAPYPPIP
jgi:hypothetical protein